MNTASLENCKRLSELSGWDDTEKNWYRHYGGTDDTFDVEESAIGVFVDNKDSADKRGWVAKRPAYDCGYLLRKLPNGVAVDKDSKGYGARRPPMYGSPENPPFTGQIRFPADTPEDALCLLAIKLYEENTLTKSNNERTKK